MISQLIAYRRNIVFNLFLLLIAFSAVAQETNNDSNNTDSYENRIESEYHPRAILISKESLSEGRDAFKTQLIEFYKSRGGMVEFETKFKIPVYDILEYEISSSQTAKGGSYAHIFIWSKEQGSEQKIAELVFEKSGSSEISPELAKARKNWEKLCNKHNSKNLVTELYTEDAIYYNRGRILRGHDQLSQEYSYMNNPAYSLQLNPKHIEVVAEDLIFEIGMCSGSYNLPYILVWKQQDDGSWKIYFDSNY